MTLTPAIRNTLLVLGALLVMVVWREYDFQGNRDVNFSLEPFGDVNIERRPDGTALVRGYEDGKRVGVVLTPLIPLRVGEKIRLNIKVRENGVRPLRIAFLGGSGNSTKSFNAPWSWQEGRPVIIKVLAIDDVVTVVKPDFQIRILSDRLPMWRR